MSLKEFEGGAHIVEAVDAALTFDFSAVIVRGAVPHARRQFRNRFRGEVAPVAILHRELPELVTAEARINAWADSSARKRGSIMLGLERDGGIKQHFDGYDVSPFVMSLGIIGTAQWRTQLAEWEGMIAEGGVFEPDQPIDTFTQHADDLVIIPGMPTPSVHEVTAGPERTARLFDLYYTPIADA